MKSFLVLVLPGALLLFSSSPWQTSIGPALFRHHFIAQDLPGDNPSGYGVPSAADFDRDGDVDFTVCSRGDQIYWFENQSGQTWRRHPVGPIDVGQLAGLALDLDGDGWMDILTGRYWYRNPQNPRQLPFTRYLYDDTVQTEIHDMVSADVDADGRTDLLVLGDREGCFWYAIPPHPLRDFNWPRTTITLEVRRDRDAIHSGFSPRGVGDLDGDEDVDLVLPDRWLENRSGGQEWWPHSLPFGKRGPWGLSSRSWVVDLDADGDLDIVMVDSDQADSRAAWLENDGARPPSFQAHFLPRNAPGVRGSFHSLAVADFDGDGDLDIFTVEQEDSSIFPTDATPRWYIWENLDGRGDFAERVIFDGGLGGHDALVVDVDGDEDPDLLSKIWRRWEGNANQGREHADFLENQLR